MQETQVDNVRGFPTVAGLLLGLGGFFDGIILHQLLQWHHMLSNIYPPDTVSNLQHNTLWDGVFHQILGIHHVNETVPPSQWIYWDLGFLVWGAIMLVGGWFRLRAGQREIATALATAGS